MTLFPDRLLRPRIAVFSRFAFPLEEEAGLYEHLDRLARELGADWRMFHSVVPDPRPLDAHLRARLGTGLFVPQLAECHANDVAHFRHTQPERCKSLVDKLFPYTPQGAPPVMKRAEVLEAFAFARSVQAFGADLVLSHGLVEGSFQAFVAAHLLDLPRVLVLTETTGGFEYGQMLPLHQEQARTIVAAGPQVQGDLVARFGRSVLDKTLVATDGDLCAPHVRAVIGRALLAPRAANAAARGPMAAFVTNPHARARPAGVRPFVVVGAERTGSTMLVAMLEVRPGIACAGELWNPRSIAEGDLAWLPNCDVDREELLSLRAADPAGLHTRLLLDAAAAGASHVGQKLLYGHGIIDDRIIDALVADPDLAVIHLLRAERLQRWLSLARARLSDEWFAGPGTAPRPNTEAVALDVQATATEFALGELLEERFRALFAHHQVLELDYEDLAQRLPQSARRLGAFLGVDLAGMVPRSHKTGPRDPADGIENYAELRAALAGTRWSPLFGSGGATGQ